MYRLIFLFFLFITACTEPVQTVKTLTVHLSTQVNRASFSGTVLPQEKIPLGFQHSGQLALLNVVAGDQVEKGQLLATLTPTGPQAEVLTEAKTAEEAALLRLEKAQLRKISKKALRNLQRQHANAVKAHEAAQAPLQLIAPEDGIIVDIAAAVEQPLKAGQVILHLATGQEIVFSSADDLQRKQPVKVLLPDQSIVDGRVQSIDEASTPPTITVTLKKIQTLALNTPVEVLIENGPGLRGALLPARVLQADQSVLLATRGKVTRKPVTIISQTADTVFVGGLTENDKVIVSATDKLTEGQHVKE
jgi:multidrug efflux pump subunit AcrA (membrane-fusion protein)